MQVNNIKIGFIGFGNMAQALAQGWLLSDEIKGSQLYASARDQEKLAKTTQKLGIQAVASNEELVDTVDIVIAAVKPYQMEAVIKPLAEKLKNKVFISVAVNFLHEEFKELLLPNTQHLSTLPNTPVAFADGIILLEATHSLNKENFQIVQNLFQLISHVEIVPSAQMDIAGVVAGSAPAFVDLFIEALGDAAVKHGLNRQTSYRLISQMVRGTANLQLKTGKHPGQLKDEITSPNGTTIQGIASLEKNAFRGTIIEAVDEILKE